MRKFLVAVLVIAGLGLILYPQIQRIMTEMNQTIAISNYEEGILHYDEEEKNREFSKAREYNEKIIGIENDVAGEDYEDILDIDRGIMGTLEIPCIDVSLPIYHGTSEEVLRIGVGHMEGSGFPVGGEGNHAILTSHRGLPEAHLFTDLDKMENGDEFYVHIMGEVFAYEVDRIKVVEPSVTEDLMPVAGEDYLTLFTCTPYGINSHRLLIRGSRTEYIAEIQEQTEVKEEVKENSMKKWFVLGGVAVLMLLILAGCGTNTTTPKSLTKTYLKSVKNNDFKSANECVGLEYEETKDDLDAQMRKLVYQKMKYKVGKETIDKKTAVVEVVISGRDYQKIRDEALLETLKYEEDDEYTLKRFGEMLKEAEVVEETVSVYFRKEDKKWIFDGSNSQVQAAILGYLE